jgi:hypothetical protein
LVIDVVAPVHVDQLDQQKCEFVPMAIELICMVPEVIANLAATIELFGK